MKTVNKTLNLLELFLNGKNELSLDELSRQAAINKSTTRRIVKSLVDREFLRQPHKRGAYSLGTKFLEFNQVIRKHIPIVEIASPFLNQLGEQIDETVALAIWNGRRSIISHWIYPNHPLKVSVYDGVMTGLHQTSLGKAILAELPEEIVDSYLGKNQELERFTPHTLTNIDDFKRHLVNIRRNGVAMDDEEGYVGVRGIAAPFRNENGDVAGAVTILGPSVRLTRDRDRENIPLVKNCALKISRALGFKSQTGKPPSQ
ncbi:MAG TPA: IclR family transcriptional regulator [Dehalococcoidales bacterium]|nr:IclR family transcriptional regulator [Dehalococcoidales bacterium]